MLETADLGDTMTTSADRGRDNGDGLTMHGEIRVVLRGPDGRFKRRWEIRNLITAVGDSLYASRGAGLTTEIGRAHV